METKRTGSDVNYLRRFYWTSVAITVFCVGYGYLAYIVDCRLEFGELFGALSALFSGLAFAGIILSLQQQKAELELQREELKLTREEFKLTRGEFETQNSTLKKQRFENTFFNLVSQHNQVVRDSFFKEPGPIDRSAVTWHNAFRSAHGLLIGMANNEIVSFKEAHSYPVPRNADKNQLTKEEREEFINSLVIPWHTKNPHNLDIYFLSLQRILKFIHRSALLHTPSERHSYASLIKDQISYYEMAVILYFGLLPVEWAKRITFYIKEYKVLDGIDTGGLITLYDKQMFDEFAIRTEPQ